MSESTKYFGKYRGTVLMNIDPLQTGRLLVQVPDVYGLGTSSWALACVPLAGKQTGTWFVPQIGTGVGRIRKRRPGLSDLERLLVGLRR